MIRLIDYKNYDDYAEAKGLWNDGCVAEVDWVETETYTYEVGRVYRDMVIDKAYVHPESSCAWIVLHPLSDNGNQLFEFGIENPIKFGINKDTSRLSGGSQW